MGNSAGVKNAGSVLGVLVEDQERAACLLDLIIPNSTSTYPEIYGAIQV